MDERSPDARLRRVISSAFSMVQDVVYVALGLLLAVSAGVLLVQAGVAVIDAAWGNAGRGLLAVVTVLDRILLALMLGELLYTVQVSFREHALVPEPFLLVALIAAVRRILVITAEFSAQEESAGSEHFKRVMWELGLLTVLIVVLVAALVVLQRKTGADRAARSHHG